MTWGISFGWYLTASSSHQFERQACSQHSHCSSDQVYMLRAPRSSLLKLVILHMYGLQVPVDFLRSLR